jgi:hypothetical protein
MRPKSHTWLDYRKAIRYASVAPRSQQPRLGGPPLLFATDARMTILVTLAVAGGPILVPQLWKHLGVKTMRSCLCGLESMGLAIRWHARGRAKFVSLDPDHPVAAELCVLLLKIGELYKFRAPPSDPDNGSGAGAPHRPRRRRDPRVTFGAMNRTLPLLIVHIRGSASGEQIARCMPPNDRRMVLHVLWMFRAFGILKSTRAGRGIAYSFNSDCPFLIELRAVLAALDEVMPQWRTIVERDVREPRFRSRDAGRGGRKTNRWRWQPYS